MAGLDEVARRREPGRSRPAIVRARSAAEMPVVTPSRASIETVNAVSNGDSFFAAIRSSPSSSQRSGVEREADQPAPLPRHEVDRLGRRELGGDREVALVLAVLVVADDDHPPGADVLDRLLDRARTAALIGRTSFSTYFATTSTSRLTGAPGRGVPERRALERLGDQRHGEGVVVDVDDGERDAVDRDRALLDDVAQQLRRARRSSRRGRSRPARRRGRSRGRRRGPARCGRRAGRTRAATARGSRRRPRRPRPSEERRSVSCITSARKPPPAIAVGGQADAVDGDRVALGDLAGEPRRARRASRRRRRRVDGGRPCRGPGRAR